MGVDGPKGARVLDDHDLAIAAEPPAVDDSPRLCGKDRCSSSGRDVDPLMRPAPSLSESGAQSPAHRPDELQPGLFTRRAASLPANLVGVPRAARIGIRDPLRTRPKTLSSARDVQALPDSEFRYVPDAIGARDCLCGYAVAETDAVEIFSGFHVMDDTWPAGSRACTAGSTKNRAQHDHEGERSDRPGRRLRPFL